MKNFIKAVKKLSPKRDDILVITLTGYPNGQEIEDLKNTLRATKLNPKVLILDERMRIASKNENKGKHIVYLNNLQYLEYLNNNREIVYGK